MSRNPKVLLTGFSSFPGAPQNPTKVILQKLRKNNILPAKSVIFPTSYRVVSRYLPTILNRVKPDIILSFGLNAEAKGFCLETTAWNEASQADLDIFNCTGPEKLVQSAPERFRSPMPLDELSIQLQYSGFYAELSTDPGRYLCNFLYFNTLSWMQENNPSGWAAFIHIPHLMDTIAAAPLSTTEKKTECCMAVEDLFQGISEIHRFCCNAWLKNVH